MSTFDEDQRRYFLSEINLALPTTNKTDGSALEKALMNVDPLMPSENHRVLDIDRYFSTFGRNNDLSQRDATCRALSYPGISMRDASARTGCGWWLTTEPTVPSVGSYGSRDGPMNPELEKQIGKGTWIWDPEDAYKQESEKYANRIKTCKDLDYFKQFPNIGWCNSMNRAVLTDGNGRSAYPKSQAGFCPDGETIIMNSGSCPIPRVDSATSSSGSNVSNVSKVGIADICAPGSNGLRTNACLQSVTNTICSPNGTLSKSFNGGFPTSIPSFNDTNAYLIQRGFTLHPGLIKDGNITVESALSSVTGLKQYADSGERNLAAAAAANLCYGSEFSPCIIPDSKLPPFDITCVKRAMLTAGFKSSGALYNANISTWNSLSNWRAVLDKLTWWKNLADKGPAFHGTPQDQGQAIKNVYGVSVNYPNFPPFTIAGNFKVNTTGGVTYYTITDSTTIIVNGDMTKVGIFAVGGGGWGGRANGGGGGGVQTNTPNLAFRSQYTPLNMVSCNTYKITIGAGGALKRGGDGTDNNGGDTTITGPGVNITAFGGAAGGYSGQWCGSPTGGSGGGGGGCTSVGKQGGSTNTPATLITNAGAGAGGHPTSYNNGGPGIKVNGVEYGAAAQTVAQTFTALPNTGGGGAHCVSYDGKAGNGGSGVVIMIVGGPILSAPPPAPVELAVGTIALGDVGMPPGYIMSENWGLIVSTSRISPNPAAVKNIQDNIKNGVNYNITVTDNKGKSFISQVKAIDGSGGFYTTITTADNMDVAFPRAITSWLQLSIRPE